MLVLAVSLVGFPRVAVLVLMVVLLPLLAFTSRRAPRSSRGFSILGTYLPLGVLGVSSMPHCEAEPHTPLLFQEVWRAGYISYRYTIAVEVEAPINPRLASPNFNTKYLLVALHSWTSRHRGN